MFILRIKNIFQCGLACFTSGHLCIACLTWFVNGRCAVVVNARMSGSSMAGNARQALGELKLRVLLPACGGVDLMGVLCGSLYRFHH